nr:MAG TPA: hypothetical protein [Caudoviricetes sp.]
MIRLLVYVSKCLYFCTVKMRQKQTTVFTGANIMIKI